MEIRTYLFITFTLSHLRMGSDQVIPFFALCVFALTTTPYTFRFKTFFLHVINFNNKTSYLCGNNQ